MIAIVTYIEKEMGRPRELISHGINIKTLETVILPQISLSEAGAVFSQEICSWVLPEEPVAQVKRPRQQESAPAPF
ncbi:hypothetical protein D3C87_703110 [compost metagenome]